MKLKLIGIAVALAVAGSAYAQTDRKVKNAEEDKIEAQYKADKARCDAMTGNAKDVCVKEAKGKETIGKAELNAKADPSERNQRKVQEAKAEAAYDVAKERCDDLKGNEKDACQKDAKAQHEKAKASLERRQSSSGSSTTAR